MNLIPFNKVYLTGKEAEYVQDVFNSGKFSGGADFTDRCNAFFLIKYAFNETLLTTSCTAALEMAAMLINIKPGDEVIIPSYTFVSTANAFAMRGAKIIFVDSCTDNPNMDVSKLEALITDKTRAVVPVHYAGIACDMDKILAITNKYNLFVIEDAAHAINAFYKDRSLGSSGHLGTFSFHETKNITSGEGGMLIINNQAFSDRASILIDKGTNRKVFFEGKIDKYEWVDIGSSFRLPELSAAFLLAQLEELELIQSKRNAIWQIYYTGLKELDDKGFIKLPVIPEYAKHNSSIFYFVCRDKQQRNTLLHQLIQKGIAATFHYQPLHLSPYYTSLSGKKDSFPNAEMYAECLLRLPLYPELLNQDLDFIINVVKKTIAEI